MTRTNPTSGPLTDVSFLDVPSAESTHREVNGVDLHVVVAGETSDPLVVLLHGFPECWYCWQEYVGPLVDAGYRVLVPDQRGYNASEKPDRARAYRLAELARDVVELVRSAGRESARVVGHDFGGLVAWYLALEYPGVVDRLGIVNAPHPRAYLRTLPTSPRQVLKSWYVPYFQLPRLPEWGCRYDDFRALVGAMDEYARPGTFDQSDWERYRAAWRQPGAIRAMIDWYRALVRYLDLPSRTRVTAPTLIVWGEDDQGLVPELAGRSVAYCEDGRLERFPDASHWIHHEFPDRIAGILVEHLGGVIQGSVGGGMIQGSVQRSCGRLYDRRG